MQHRPARRLRFLAATSVVSTALVFALSGASIASAATSLPPMPGILGRMVIYIEPLANEISTLEATVAGFATNFVSAHITVTTLDATTGNFQELCVGSTCVTPQQFHAMVAAAGASQPAGNAAASPSDTATSSDEEATDTPPVIQINGDNPATVQVGATYTDLGATISGPQQDLNLGIQTFVNGTAVSPVEITTTQAATDTIAYVVTDAEGNTATSTRTVIVAPALTPPSVSTATTTEATSTVQ
jgi:hypothetical protein